LPYINTVEELQPAHSWLNGVVKSALQADRPDQISQTAKEWAASLRGALEESIRSMLKPGFGSWLSGGLDSSAIAAIARPYTDEMHTFAAGVAGASDLEYARIVADHIGSIHHELMVDLNSLQDALPKVIFHLESFDPLLVRSSITNYLVAELSAQFVPVVFSGEGGDELFAGYEYLKDIPENRLEGELEDITSRLHNTALQRVDRCASAHGLQALVPFLHPLVLEQAHSIPVEYKIVEGVEKWILRHAVEDLLPESVVWRPKAKFWEGAGVTDLLALCAEITISDVDYRRERALPNGRQLHSKEELLYYRIFKEHFGEMESLDWMGRTKGSPEQQEQVA
jgi:asparagine synthase (glutamine-hydrolysing)